MPFRHPDRSHDLEARITHEVRERLEEAVDFVCLDALVQARRAHGRAAPVADSPEDRGEFHARVKAFLERLEREVGEGLTAEQQRKARAAAATADDEHGRLLAVQVALARELPDYWQRFEAVRLRSLAEPPASGGQRPGFLARLFGRG